MLSFENLGEFFKKTFLESPVPTMVLNEHTFLLANHSFCHYFQYDSSEIAGLSFDNITPPRVTEPSHLDLVTKQDLHLKHCIIERYLSKKDGTALLAELSLIQHSFEDGQYVIVFIRDITHHKTKNEKLYENEKRLRLALKASNQAIWDWNNITDETYYSDDYFLMLGYEPDEFKPSYSKWVELVHPEDREMATYAQKLYLESKSSKYEIDFRLQKKDGSYIWTHTRAIILSRDEQGIPSRIMGVVVNIDDKKRKEEIIHDQTQKLIEFAFYNSHILRSPVARALGLLQLMKLEDNPIYFDLVEKSIHEIDDIIRKMNETLIVTPPKNTDAAQEFKKITYVASDKISQFVYKKLTERYNTTLHTHFNEDLSELIVHLDKGESLDHIIVVDMQVSNDTIWQQMDLIKTRYHDITVFLLTDFISLEDIVKAKEFPCIKGIFLKPLTMDKIRQLFS